MKVKEVKSAPQCTTVRSHVPDNQAQDNKDLLVILAYYSRNNPFCGSECI